MLLEEGFEMSEGTRVINLGDAMARIERLERRDEFHQMLLRTIVRELGGKVSVPSKYEESAREYNEAGAAEVAAEISATQVAEAA